MNTLTDYMSSGIMIDIKQAGSGVAGIVNGAKVCPYIAPKVPLSTSVLGDFTLSVDTNLTPKSITWGGAYRRPAGGVAIDGAVVLFQLADVANACQVFGMCITDTAGTVLLYAEQFAAPINLQTVLDGFIYAPQVAVGGQDNGKGTVIQ